MGLPFFPSDFPDCKAYSCSMVDKAAALKNKAEHLSPYKRPLRVPIPSPWGIVRITCNKGTSAVEIPEVSTMEDVISANSLPNSCCGSFNISFECDPNVFDGTVARTGFMLTTFLNDIQAGQLLLFPHVLDRKARVYQFIKGEAKLDLSHRSSVIYDRKLCFLRVHLRPYKEGTFDEGAVVCAPYLSDISLWISR